MYANSIPIANRTPMNPEELIHTMGSGEPIFFHQDGYYPEEIETKDFSAELRAEKLHVFGANKEIVVDVKDFIPGTLAILFSDWVLYFSGVLKANEPKPKRDDLPINIPIDNAVQMDLDALFNKLGFVNPKQIARMGSFSEASAKDFNASYFGNGLTVMGGGRARWLQFTLNVDDYIPGTVAVFLEDGWIRVTGIPKPKE